MKAEESERFKKIRKAKKALKNLCGHRVRRYKSEQASPAEMWLLEEILYDLDACMHHRKAFEFNKKKVAHIHTLWTQVDEDRYVTFVPLGEELGIWPVPEWFKKYKSVDKKIRGEKHAIQEPEISY